MRKPRAPYSRPVADRIVAGLRRGQGLRALCRGPDMPTRPTVMRWLAERPDFARRVQAARRRGGLDRPGRPSGCRPDLVDEIFDRLWEGGSLKALCRAPDMPGRSTVQAWARTHEEVAHTLALAREIADWHAAELLFEALGGWDYFGRRIGEADSG